MITPTDHPPIAYHLNFSPFPLDPPYLLPEAKKTPWRGMQWVGRGALGLLILVVMGLSIYSVTLTHSSPKIIPRPTEVMPSTVAPQGFMDAWKKQSIQTSPSRASTPPTLLSRDPVDDVFKPQVEAMGQCVQESRRLLTAPGVSPHAAEQNKSAALTPVLPSSTRENAEERAFLEELAHKIHAVMHETAHRMSMRHPQAWASDLVTFACQLYRQPEFRSLHPAHSWSKNLLWEMIHYHSQVWRHNEHEAERKNQRNTLDYTTQLHAENRQALEDQRNGHTLQFWLLFLLATVALASLYFAVMDMLLRPQTEG